ncbi:MAG: hypothetical protein JWN40_3356 [Phycisphaerales bacterium]|nr:hypothetical protein [Phycisphaerales bacterium]
MNSPKHIDRVHNEVVGMICAGGSTEEIDQWLEANLATRKDLIEVIRLLVDELGEMGGRP